MIAQAADMAIPGDELAQVALQHVIERCEGYVVYLKSRSTSTPDVEILRVCQAVLEAALSAG